MKIVFVILKLQKYIDIIGILRRDICAFETLEFVDFKDSFSLFCFKLSLERATFEDSIDTSKGKTRTAECNCVT